MRRLDPDRTSRRPLCLDLNKPNLGPCCECIFLPRRDRGWYEGEGRVEGYSKICTREDDVQSVESSGAHQENEQITLKHRIAAVGRSRTLPMTLNHGSVRYSRQCHSRSDCGFM